LSINGQLVDLLYHQKILLLGFPMAYGTRTLFWCVTNHGAKLLGRAIFNDVTLHVLDLCTCCVGMEGLEILLLPIATNEVGQQPKNFSINNPFVSYNDFDVSGCEPTTK
jgi:hypothetical protein